MIRIIESITRKADGNSIATITGYVPLTIQLHSKRSDAEYIDRLREMLQIETQTIFEHIGLLASLEDGYVQRFKVADFAEIIQTLSFLGKALIEAQDRDELKIDESLCHREKPVETETSDVLDLSEQTEDCQRLNKLAVNISEVLKNPLTPQPIYNCLSEYMANVPVDTDAPEWILGNLKIMKEGEKSDVQ